MLNTEYTVLPCTNLCSSIVDLYFPYQKQSPSSTVSVIDGHISNHNIVMILRICDSVVRDIAFYDTA